jgi:DNA-binding SARP family transcriptional activator
MHNARLVNRPNGNGKGANNGAGQQAMLPANAVDQLLRFGLIVTDSSGTVTATNETAKHLITEAHGYWPEDARCCSLFGCHHYEPLSRHCITDLAACSDEPLPEIRVDLPPENPAGAVWITAARMSEDGSQVVMHLRQADMADRRRRTQPHWMAGPRLRIRALGRTQVETEEVAIEGGWLLQRPGQLLKYLVCQRGRPAHVDQIVEALWPDAGVNGRKTVRHYVHVLRERVEPSRSPRTPSAFITSTGSAYSLDPRVTIDVDEFEDLVTAGLRDAAAGEANVDFLERAISLYGGDLFAEEPFAEWAFAEREMLRGLAYQALSQMIEHYLEGGDLPAATVHLERACELRPVDDEVQRQLIDVYMRQGRNSDASRRLATFRQRMLDEFGQEPGFTLAELVTSNTNKETGK